MGNHSLTKSLPSLMGCSRLTGHWISFFFFSLYSLMTTSIYVSAGSLNADDLLKYNCSLDLSSDLQPPVQTFYLNLHLNIKCPSHSLSQWGPWSFDQILVLLQSSSRHVCVLSHFSCVQLCNPIDCSLPGSSVHRILQVRTLEWVTISSSRGIFPTQGSNSSLSHLCIGKWILYHWCHLGSPSWQLMKAPSFQWLRPKPKSHSVIFSDIYIHALPTPWWEGHLFSPAPNSEFIRTPHFSLLHFQRTPGTWLPLAPRSLLPVFLLVSTFYWGIVASQGCTI